MTYINRDLDKICVNWCPIADYCEDEHECENRKKLKNIIKKITGTNNEN